MKPFRWHLILFFCLLPAMTACGNPPSDPLIKIRGDLQKQGIEEYSIVLADMQESGNFIKSYSHTYNVITPEKTTPYGPLPVPEKMYDHYKPYLGMTIWSQTKGETGENIAPPGYAYVGDPRYGQWSQDSSGRSFWTFYGQYRLLSDLLGLGGRLFRDQYDTYRGYHSQRRPYYGPNRDFGTGGTLTRKQYPTFFERQQARASASRATFTDKVNQRIGRTRTISRARGISGGK
jgi:hypothetical protein